MAAVQFFNCEVSGCLLSTIGLLWCFVHTPLSIVNVVRVMRLVCWGLNQYLYWRDLFSDNTYRWVEFGTSVVTVRTATARNSMYFRLFAISKGVGVDISSHFVTLAHGYTVYTSEFDVCMIMLMYYSKLNVYSAQISIINDYYTWDSEV